MTDVINDPKEFIHAKCKYSRTYPPSLMKAVWDPYIYAVRLTTGEFFCFEQAEYVDDVWVRLKGAVLESSFSDVCGPHYDGKNTAGNYAYGDFSRGVEVRVEHIVWCIDAPKKT